MAKRAIDLLRTAPGLTGSYADSFVTRDIEDDHEWLDVWFRQRVQEHFAADSDIEESFDQTEHDELRPPRPASSSGARLTTVNANYFRGFREHSFPVDLRGDLIVIEGRNSSGKTSLSEAIEFLLTGGLSRREQLGKRNASELEKFVGNRLRPADESTWVEATFIVGEPQSEREFTLRRELVNDYGSKVESKCESVLFLNGNRLTDEDEKALLNELVAGEPPLLTQHALREFVHSPPAERRRFFETLLQLNDLTRLIEVSVVTDHRLPEFDSPHGSKGLSCWNRLYEVVADLEDESAKRVWEESTKQRWIESEPIESALTTIAEHSLNTPDGIRHFADVTDWVQEEQRKTLRRSFPLLQNLRPTLYVPSTGDDAGEADDDSEVGAQPHFDDLSEKLTQAWNDYSTASLAVESIGESKLAIHRALRNLREAGLIEADAERQLCPLCTHDSPMTLTSQRLQEIDSWTPGDNLVQHARQRLDEKLEEMRASLRSLLEDVERFIPRTESEDGIRSSVAMLDNDVQKMTDSLVAARDQAYSELDPTLEIARQLILVKGEDLRSGEDCEKHVTAVRACVALRDSIEAHARTYSTHFEQLEEAVTAEASKSPEYQRIQAWLDCAQRVRLIANDFRWESCKREVQQELKHVRDVLINFRTAYLESRRFEFNNGIHDIWRKLRADAYSKFSELRIPPPRRRGFPVVLEVKATLDDGTITHDVDALSVFSESQVNALGIATFVTRSRLLGHGMIVLDDPVQSMDEEHFKSFARDLLPEILDQGFQVILMTHSDLFARDISYHHSDRDSYVTLEAKPSRRKGCQVEEGNRRMPERLKKAERQAEEGNLKEAWVTIRHAIERLYILTNHKHGGSTFDPLTWHSQSAEAMWNEGAGRIIEELVPKASIRLKEMLEMTAGGAHDKPARGYTDVIKSIEYLRTLPEKLRVGG